MDLPSVERDIRRVPGVLACQVTAGDVVVLVAPDADADAVSDAVRALLAMAAVTPPSVRLIGGRAPVVPLRRRHGRRAVAAATASAAALAAAGVAAAVSGVFTPSPDRPSVGEEHAAGPAPTSPAAPGGPPADARTRRAGGGPSGTGGTAETPPATASVARPPSEVQPDRQLATLAAGAPALLTFPIPLPGEVAAPPRRSTPPPKPPAAEVGAGDEAAAPVAPTTTSPPTTGPPPTAPPAPPAPVFVPPPTTAPAPSASSYDEHDNDRGERAHDSNGHSETGPQGGEFGRRGERGRD